MEFNVLRDKIWGIVSWLLGAVSFLWLGRRLVPVTLEGVGIYFLAAIGVYLLGLLVGLIWYNFGPGNRPGVIVDTWLVATDRIQDFLLGALTAALVARLIQALDVFV